MTHLGETVRVLRVERNMSQRQLAQAAGVARSYISMIEGGSRTNIGTETLDRLATALGLSAGAILSRSAVTLSSVDPPELTPEARRLAERIDALPPGAHERAISLVDSVVRGVHAAHEEQAYRSTARSIRGGPQLGPLLCQMSLPFAGGRQVGQRQQGKERNKMTVPNKRILYVEDGETEISLMTAYLMEHAPDMGVHTVETFPEYLKELGERPYDAVLARYHLPMATGPELLQATREGGHDVPVVFIADNGDEEALAEAASRGTVHYVIGGEGYPARTLLALQQVIELQRLAAGHAQQTALLAGIVHVGDQMRLQLTLSAVLDFICESIRESLGWGKVVVRMRDGSGAFSRPVSAVGMSAATKHALLAAAPSPVTEWYVHERFRAGHVYLIRNLLSQAEVECPAHIRAALTVEPREERGENQWQADDLLIVPIDGPSGRLGTILITEPASGLRPTTVDIQGLEILANQAATAIESAYLYRQISLEKGRFQLLDEIGHQVGSSLDLGHVLGEVLSLTISAMEAERGSILVLEEGEQVTYRILSHEPDQQESTPVVSPVLDDGLSRWVLDHAVGVLIADVRDDERWYTFPDERWPSRSVICVPLKIRQRVRAVMTITHTRPKNFDEDDLRLAEAIADRVAWAVENAWLYAQTDEKLRKRVSELDALNTIAAAMGRSLDLDQILDNALNQILRATGTGAGAVHLWDTETEALTLRVHQGLPPELAARLERMSLREVSLTESSMSKGEPVLVDLAGQPQTERHRQAAEMGFRTLIAIAIQTRGRFLGSLLLASQRELGIAPEMRHLLVALAHQLGMAVENARLFGETRRRAEQLATINAIGESVGRTLDEDAILNTSLERLLAAVGAEYGGAYLREEAQLVLRAHRGFPPGFTDNYRPVALDERPSSWLKAPATACERVEEREGRIPETDKQLGIQSWASCPLLAGDDLLGVVILSSRQHDLFSDAETNILATVSHQAAAALQKARLYRAEQERANQLETIHAVMATASSSLDPTEIVSKVLEQAMELTGMEIGGAYFQEESGDLVLAAQRGMSAEHLAEVTRFGPGDGVVGCVAESGQMLYTTEYSEEDWALPAPFRNLRTALAMPLPAAGRVFGVAFLASAEVRPLRADVIRLLEVIGDEIGVAIQNARLFTRIRQAEERQRAILESSLDAIISGDAERGITVWSAGAEEVFGWSRDEALGRSSDRIALEDDAERRQKGIQELLRPTGFIRNHVTRARHKDGHLIDIEVSASLLDSEDGRSEVFTAVIRDITARLQRERLLQALNEAATAMAPATTPEEIFNAAGRVFLKLDIQCMALVADATREHLRLAYNTLDPVLLEGIESLLGSPLAEFPISIDGHETYSRVIRERVSLISRDPLDAIVRKPIEGPHGHEGPLAELMRRSVVISAPLIVKGAVMGVLSVLSPALQEENVPAITAFAHQLAAAWHKAELFTALEESMTELERAQARLVQSEKMWAIGRLVSGVAHELNNPLTAVMGYSQLLEGADLNPRARKDLDKIRHAAERCSRIVKDLLTFVREYRPERTSIDINDLLDQTFAMRSYQLRVQNIRIVRQYESDLPLISGDPHRLEEVFMNLLTNAEQAMHQAHGRGTLTVRTMLRTGEPGPPPAGQPPGLDVPSPALRIEFEDDGSGIPPDVVKHIFDPFFTTREVGQGTGLGLSICYGIIGEHHGRIWADSRARGGGTRFIVELPVSTSEAMEPGESLEPFEQIPDEEIELPEIGVALAVGKRVLVVDDEEPVVSLVHRILEKLGCQVAMASSGEEALRHLNSEQFDAIISDLKMPGMSGQELYTRTLAEMPEVAERFIFVTGDVITPGTGDFIKHSGRLSLSKPFTSGEIIAVLLEMLGKQESQRGSA